MFVTTATCAPARAELYTGLFPKRNGVYRNYMSSEPVTKSLAHYLSDLGYRVGLDEKKRFSNANVYPLEYVEEIACLHAVTKVRYRLIIWIKKEYIKTETLEL